MKQKNKLEKQQKKVCKNNKANNNFMAFSNTYWRYHTYNNRSFGDLLS
jgi:hypothetical protein